MYEVDQEPYSVRPGRLAPRSRQGKILTRLASGSNEVTLSLAVSTVPKLPLAYYNYYIFKFLMQIVFIQMRICPVVSHKIGLGLHFGKHS